jgi:hypothetical protein
LKYWSIGAILALAATIGAVSTAALESEAAYPGTNGPIAYTDLDADGQIFVVNPDGSGRRQITSITSEAQDPAFSADGQFIVYSSDTRLRQAELNGPNDDGYLGTDGGRHPSVSPDGTRLAFVRDEGSGSTDVLVSNPGFTNLTNTPDADEGNPDWSPDGTQIVFGRDDSGNVDLFVVPPSGGAAENMTDTPDTTEQRPDWSPDGQHIIFSMSTDELPGTSNIWRIDADGGNLTQLTDGGADFDPAYSPDGQFIVFQRDVIGGNALPQGSSNNQIFVANADGSNPHSISGPGTHRHQSPDWGVAEPLVGPNLAWGDHDCSGDHDPADALFGLRAGAGVEPAVPAGDGCPLLGETLVTLSFGELVWGDVDCDGAIDGDDSLRILADAAGLPFDNLQDCPALGVLITLADV